MLQTLSSAALGARHQLGFGLRGPRICSAGLGHLGLQVRVSLATEVDPSKRALLKVMHESIGCQVDRVMTDV